MRRVFLKHQVSNGAERVSGKLWSWINVGNNMCAQALWKLVSYLFSQIKLLSSFQKKCDSYIQ